MGNEYGRVSLGTIGHGIAAFIDPEYKPGGISVDWATVAAAGADVTWEDGVLLEAGRKGLRYGQIMTQITASSKYGPYDPAAADGRQTLARGACYILDRSILEDDPMSNHPAGAAEGGLAWKARILATTGAASLAAGPTFATLEPVVPRLRYAQ
jgi:hypothetical protein